MHANKQLVNRDATIPFFQNRSDTENSENRPIPIQSDTSAVLFFYQCNLEFLYFSVEPIVALLCVKHNLLQCFSTGRSKVLVCSPEVGHETVLSGSRIVYSQRNDIINKNIILNTFLKREFILKDVDESRWHCQIIWLRCSLSKERVPEKKVLSRFSICGQMRGWQV